MAILERLAPAAALAVAGDPIVELDDLRRLPLGERHGCRFDAGDEIVDDLHDRGAGAVEPVRHCRESAPPFGEVGIGGEDTVALDAAARRRRRFPCRLLGDALGP